jgi:hypothetical protein
MSADTKVYHIPTNNEAARIKNTFSLHSEPDDDERRDDNYALRIAFARLMRLIYQTTPSNNARDEGLNLLETSFHRVMAAHVERESIIFDAWHRMSFDDD